MKNRHIAFGLLFGFVLSRAGATSYDAIAGMFRLTDLHLYGVMGVAVVVCAAGFALFRRGWIPSRGHEFSALVSKPMTPGLVWGALLFGVGWAIAGTCPGTAIAQIGEGHLAGVFTFAGIVIGAWLQQTLPSLRATVLRWRLRAATEGA